MFTPLRRIPRTPMEKPSPHIHELETELTVLQSHSKYYNVGPPGGFGDLGRMAFYFQGSGEQWQLF